MHSIKITESNITEIPPEIKELPELCKLDLSRNVIHNIPPSLAEAPKLRYLHLEKNPISHIPMELQQSKSLYRISINTRSLSVEEAQLVRDINEQETWGLWATRRLNHLLTGIAYCCCFGFPVLGVIYYIFATDYNLWVDVTHQLQSQGFYQLELSYNTLIQYTEPDYFRFQWERNVSWFIVLCLSLSSFFIWFGVASSKRVEGHRVMDMLFVVGIYLMLFIPITGYQLWSQEVVIDQQEGVMITQRRLFGLHRSYQKINIHNLLSIEVGIHEWEDGNGNWSFFYNRGINHTTGKELLSFEDMPTSTRKSLTELCHFMADKLNRECISGG